MADHQTSDDEAVVSEHLDRLLTRHDPRAMTMQEFWTAQYDHGLAWVHFPVGFGGLGTGPGLQKLVNQRLLEEGAAYPAGVNPMGIGMAGPTIATHGSDEQKRRYLRRCFACEDLWCQLFSEPGAGSDVANLSTSAQKDGNEWIVNGQKVWTTLAHVARWGLLLARTDPAAPKHRGLTYFVVDMHAPGVETRPIKQADGRSHFNEVYFTNVHIADSERLGAVGAGWPVALTTLMNERVLLGSRSDPPAGSGPIATVLEIWNDTDNKASRRDELMRLWVRAEVGRMTAIRADRWRDAGVPGPEGSVSKLANAELEQDIYRFGVGLLGARGMLYPWYDTPANEQGMDGEPDPRLGVLSSLATTIAGGTSEIMRNVLGERVLNLPADARSDRDVAWNTTRRA